MAGQYSLPSFVRRNTIVLIDGGANPIGDLALQAFIPPCSTLQINVDLDRSIKWKIFFLK